MFDGFKKSDYAAFQSHKWKSPDFDDERAEVYKKLFALREILTPHMQRFDSRFSGRIGQSHIYRKHQMVDCLWLSFIITKSRKYIHLPQLHIDLASKGVFVGLAVPVKTDEYKSNMASWLISYPAQALKMLRKLDTEHVHLLVAGDENYDISKLDVDKITSIGKKMMDETEWTSWGEFYYRSEKNILGISAFAGRALTVFRKVSPVYEVAMGFSDAIPILKRILKCRAVSKTKRTSKSPPNPPSTQQERVDIDSKGHAIERNPEVVAWVKEIEESNCQVCGKTILLPNGQKTIDAHHIWCLGSPHGGYELGFDCTENTICLCPNHHREMDNGIFYIEPQTLKIIYHDESNEYHGTELRIHHEHRLSEAYLEYHRDFIFEKWSY